MGSMIRVRQASVAQMITYLQSINANSLQSTLHDDSSPPKLWVQFPPCSMLLDDNSSPELWVQLPT